MISVTYSPTTASCLEFWFYMNGAEAYNQLQVYIKRSSDLGVPVWVNTGSKGSKWNLVQLNIVSPQEYYEVVFEAISGSNQNSEEQFVFGIDDVVVRDGDCPLTGNCDFENGACTWMNNANTGSTGISSQLQWLIGDGLNDVTPYAPSTDHTFGTPAGFCRHKKSFV